MGVGVAALLAMAVTTGAAAEPMASVASMRHHRRVLIVAARSQDDQRLVDQRRSLAAWRDGARDRDLSIVSVVGTTVTGASDTAASLRQAWRLPPAAFAAVLIGKDGHEALRSSEALSATALERTIDAMPMRRAGRR